MKIWIIASLVATMLIAGFLVVNALQTSNDLPIVESSPEKTPSCSGAGSCGGSCTPGNSCSSPTCGVEKTGSCGCGKK